MKTQKISTKHVIATFLGWWMDINDLNIRALLDPSRAERFVEYALNAAKANNTQLSEKDVKSFIRRQNKNIAL